MIVDSRELKVIEYLNKKNIAHTVETLEVGDIFHYPILAERKTVSDLKNSFCDKRYYDQISRMVESRSKTPELKIFYIIEKNKYLNLGSIISSLEIEHGFFVYVSKSISDTVSFVLDSIKKLDKPPLDIDSVPLFPKVSTPKRFTLSVYQGIPGIGKVHALKLYDVYPSVYELVKAIENNDFKTDGFSEKIIKNIYSFIKNESQQVKEI